MTRIRIGFVGTGTMGQIAHLLNYRRLPEEVEVVALAEHRVDLGERVASRYGVSRVYQNAEDMVSAEQLDALVAPQQFMRHLEVVGPLYAFGLPILTEKPLAMSKAIGDELIALLDASPTPFHMVGYHKRSDPAIERAKQLVSQLQGSGRWGSVRYLRMTMSGVDWSLGSLDDVIVSEVAPASTEDAPRDIDYLTFINFYAHQLNLIRHMLGESYEIVYADKTGHLIVGESASGIPITFEMATWGEPGWDESVVIGFDDGQISVTLPAPLASRQSGRLEVRGDLGLGFQTAVPVVSPDHAFLNQARNFVAAVRGEPSPLSEAHDASDDLRLADKYFAVKGA